MCNTSNESVAYLTFGLTWFPRDFVVQFSGSRKLETEKELVFLTQRVHLFPFRTQKLSFAVPKILYGRLYGKIGQCQHIEVLCKGDFDDTKNPMGV